MVIDRLIGILAILLREGQVTAGDLQRLTRQHLPLLGVDGGIHPGDGLLFHRTAPCIIE